MGFFILKSDSMSAAREHKQFQLSKSIPDNRFFMEVRNMAKIFNAHHVFILRYQLICTYSFLANYQNSFVVVVVAIWKKKRQLGLFSFWIVTTTKITSKRTIVICTFFIRNLLFGMEFSLGDCWRLESLINARGINLEPDVQRLTFKWSNYLFIQTIGLPYQQETCYRQSSAYIHGSLTTRFSK